MKGLFATITNANFNRQLFVQKIRDALALRARLLEKLISLGGVITKDAPECATWHSNYSCLF